MANHRVLAANGSTSAISPTTHGGRTLLQRANPEGVDLLHRGAARGEHHVAAGNLPRGERNWDYRCLDSRLTFALWGLYTPGLDREADDFFVFIADVSGANTMNAIRCR